MYFFAICVLAIVGSTLANVHEDPNKQLDQLKISATYLAKYVEKPDNKESELVLKHAREHDDEDCLLRTICKLVAVPEPEGESKLVQKVRSILSRGFENETLHFKKENPSFAFKYAAYIGHSNKDTGRTCHETFPVCTVSHENIMFLLNNLAQSV
ncbi:hypothetical protein HDE_02575 [Halotydeus destructor]|nr:hypothetical protein HDE_02575 [Halotydeus destructor]